MSLEEDLKKLEERKKKLEEDKKSWEKKKQDIFQQIKHHANNIEGNIGRMEREMAKGVKVTSSASGHNLNIDFNGEIKWELKKMDELFEDIIEKETDLKNEAEDIESEQEDIDFEMKREKKASIIRRLIARDRIRSKSDTRF
jgi:hypothetical protein